LADSGRASFKRRGNKKVRVGVGGGRKTLGVGIKLMKRSLNAGSKGGKEKTVQQLRKIRGLLGGGGLPGLLSCCPDNAGGGARGHGLRYRSPSSPKNRG